MSDGQVEEGGFDGLTGLAELDLSGNAFTAVPTLSFRSLSDLRRLRLDRNPLPDLPTSSFEGLAGLVELSVESCPQLVYIDLNAFSGLGSLLILRLGANLNLAALHPLAFEAPSPLRELHLRDCALPALPQPLLDWAQLELLDIAGNPIDCTCAAAWLPAVLRALPIRSAPPLCASPRHLQGRPLTGLEPAECGGGGIAGLDSPVLASIAAVAGALFLASALAVAVCLARHRLAEALGLRKKPLINGSGLYAGSDCLSSDYDLSGESKKSLLYAYSLGGGSLGGAYVGRSGTLPPSRPPPNLYASIPPPPPPEEAGAAVSRTLSQPHFRVIRNYPVPITEL